MIRPARTRRICQSCRHDLQTIFERGFCTASFYSQTRPKRSRPVPRSRVEARTLSHSSRCQVPSNLNHTSPTSQSDRHDLGQEEALLVAQAAVIEQLEKELGMSLEQAIEEDQISAELVAKYEKILNTTRAGEGDSKTSPDSVAVLRNAGASLEEIVREARQRYGDVLPDETLNNEELALYRRFYGEPMQAAEDEEYGGEAIDEDSASHNELFSPDGEKIIFRPYGDGLDLSNEHNDIPNSSSKRSGLANLKMKQLADSVRGTIMEEDEYDDVEEEDEDEDEEFSESDRGHPLTNLGKFKTNPKTIFLPQDGFVRPVERIMSNYSNKQLKEMCERTFGGPGLPDSPLTPRSGQSRKQVPIPLDAGQNTMGQMEANAFVSAVMPPTYASVQSVLVETRKRLGSTWLNNLLARDGGPRVLDAGAGGAGILAWREVVQAHWSSLHASDNEPPAPPTTKSVVLTASDGLRHRAAEMLENTTFIPRLPDYSHTRETPTLEDDRPSQQRKQFDVIIAPHTLFGFREDWMRKQYVQNLWTMLSNEGGVLILIEKGIPRGFEAIAGAREMLLDRYIAVPEGHTTHYSQSHAHQLSDEGIHKKEIAMIVAPCTNHEKCPMYTAPGLSRGRKDICSFQQRYIRPPFLQRVLGAKDRNHDDVEFSYISVLKGDDLRSRDITNWSHVTDPMSASLHPNLAELGQAHRSLVDESKEGFEQTTPDNSRGINNEEAVPASSIQLPSFNQMPRIVYPPLKRRGHVSIDLCTPAGHIERWTIPRSFSKQAYRDARKSKWGDLWALGAKTRIARNLRLGTPEKDLMGKNGEVINGKGRGRKERLKIQAMQMLEKREEEKMEDLIEQRDFMAALDEEYESQVGVSPDVIPRKEMSSGPKPMNNRERKAARKARRNGQDVSTAPHEAADDADLTFKPRAQRPRSQSVMDDLAVEHAMSEWQAEFEQETALSQGKKRGISNKFGGTSKIPKDVPKGRGKNRDSQR